MKRCLPFTLVVIILSCSLFVGAHGRATHILGTVTETTKDRIILQTSKGKLVTLVITAETSFQENGITTNTARPQVGNRLVVEAAKIENTFVAIEITFSSPISK